MRRSFRRKKAKKGRIALIAAALIAVAALLFVLFSVSGAARLSNAATFIFNPIVSFVKGAGDWFSDSAGAFGDNKALAAENRALNERVLELEAKSLLAELYLEELQEYKELLNLQKELSSFEIISAKVVFATAGNLQTGITIDKGISKGIKKGMPVLFGDKLTGIVKDADLISARVRTIFEKDFTIIARNVTNGEIMRIRGDSTVRLNELLVCDYLPLRSAIAIGDVIETSELGDTYPNAIKIGTVEKIEYDRDGYALKAYIRPFIESGKIDLVYVLDYRESTEDESAGE